MSKVSQLSKFDCNLCLLVRLANQGQTITAEGLPSWPKMMIFEALRVKSTDEKRISLLRRVIKTAANGCIAVDVLNGAAIPIPGINQPFMPANFSKVSLNLRQLQVPRDPLEFKLFANNFRLHLDNRSSEASLNGLFWFAVINHCLDDLVPKFSPRIDLD